MRIIIHMWVAMGNIDVVKECWCKYVEGDFEDLDLRKGIRFANALIIDLPTFHSLLKTFTCLFCGFPKQDT